MSLSRIVRDSTGQDVKICQACLDCDMNLPDEMDIPLGSLIQLVILNDDEALHCRTLWSDAVLEVSRNACTRGIDLQAVILALRQESTRRAD